MEQDKFAGFDILKGLTYKVVNEQPILVDVCVPKGVEGKRPLLINWHGGGLVTGTRDFRPWIATWYTQWAVRNQAILVSADYRLAPESKVAEIADDLESLWAWVHSELPSTLESRVSRISADLSKIVVSGESAGGWCAFQLGLSHPKDIRALILRFPMLDIAADVYAEPNKQRADMSAISEATFDDHLKSMVPGQIVTHWIPFPMSPRGNLFHLAACYGRLQDLFGDDPVMFPVRGLKKGDALPKKIWILHGSDDNIVPADGSLRAVNEIRAKCARTEVEIDTAPGGHGFDAEIKLGEVELCDSRLKWIEQAWLA